jgi:hypothetical protein
MARSYYSHTDMKWLSICCISSSHEAWYHSLIPLITTFLPHLQLRHGFPRVLENNLRLRRLHHIALNLKLSAHEEFLRLRLSLDELSEVVVRQVEDNIGLSDALGLFALSNFAGLLQINVPACSLAGGVLEGEREDTVALLDGILLGGLVLERVGDEIEGGGGGEGGCRTR